MAPVASMMAKIRSISMYRSVLYGLTAIWCNALVLSLFGSIAAQPVALVLTTLAICLAACVINKAMATFLRLPTNHESWLITGLILSLIVAPSVSLERLALAAFCAAIAIASKFCLTYNGSHLFNPAGFGAFVVSVAGILPVTWWVATPGLIPISLIVGGLLVYRQRLIMQTSVFVVVALAVMLLVNTMGDGLAMAEVLRTALLSWPIIFLATIMLSEPVTGSNNRLNQSLLAVVVGVIFACQLHVGPVYSTPQLALLVGNVVMFLIVQPSGRLLKVATAQRVTDSIVAVDFERSKRPVRHLAGQYADWTIPGVGGVRGNRRTFSIASPPGASQLRVMFRLPERPSDFKRWLADAKPGAVVRVGNIDGDFVLPAQSTRPIVLLAGGIGITPFLSMLQDQPKVAKSKDVSLVHFVRDQTEAVVSEPVSAAAKVIIIDTLPTAETLQMLVDASKRPLVYVSGPPPFVHATTQLLRTLHIPSSDIKTDFFDGY